MRREPRILEAQLARLAVPPAVQDIPVAWLPMTVTNSSASRCSRASTRDPAAGLVKIKVLLAFTLAAYNLETIRSFLARKAVVEEEARKPRRRKKRRKQTWHDLVAVSPATGPDPPPG